MIYLCEKISYIAFNAIISEYRGIDFAVNVVPLESKKKN